MFSTTEITSHEDASDNVIHQRLYYPYLKAVELVQGNLLELGCGAGRGIKKMLAASTHYTAIDKNRALVKTLANTFPKATFVHQHFPPFTGISDATFDYIVSFQVIEHIPDDHLFIKEIYRVLKPGGKAIITTPNKAKSLTRNPWHIREYTPRDLANLLEQYFQSVEIRGIGGSQKVVDYYQRNKQSVEKITKFDILNLQYRLPRKNAAATLRDI